MKDHGWKSLGEWIRNHRVCTDVLYRHLSTLNSMEFVPMCSIYPWSLLLKITKIFINHNQIIVTEIIITSIYIFENQVKDTNSTKIRDPQEIQ